jgi:hypothetical protein
VYICMGKVPGLCCVDESECQGRSWVCPDHNKGTILKVFLTFLHYFVFALTSAVQHNVEKYRTSPLPSHAHPLPLFAASA